MILDFKCKETQKIWRGIKSKKIPPSLHGIALRKLRMLDAALVLADLRLPPNNRLEALTGDRMGEHSIRINLQWRLCFKWQASNAHSVEIVDYH